MQQASEKHNKNKIRKEHKGRIKIHALYSADEAD